MGITFGGLPLVDPNAAAETCSRLGLPADWLGKPNAFRNALGVAPGVGHALMLRGHLDSLDLSAEHDLVFSQKQEVGPKATRHVARFRNLHVVEARCITPGRAADPNSCFLLELADRRRLAGWRPVNRGYNCRTPADPAAYIPDTLDGVSAWTWATLVADLWSAASLLGTFGGLPYSPSGTPTDFAFHGASATEALGCVLDRIGCDLKFDPDAGTFSVVRVGTADVDALKAMSQAHKVLDGEIIRPALSRYPQYLRVLFPKHPTSGQNAGSAAYYPVDVADPSGTPAGVQEGTKAQVHDPLPATFDADGDINNLAALTTRAQARAAEYFANLRNEPISRVYAAPLAALAPGATLGEAATGDLGGGALTRVGPLDLPGATPAAPMDPHWCGLIQAPAGGIPAMSSGAPGVRSDCALLAYAPAPFTGTMQVLDTGERVTALNPWGYPILAGQRCVAVRDRHSGSYWILAPAAAEAEPYNLTFVSNVCIDWLTETLTVEKTTIRSSDGSLIGMSCEDNPSGCCGPSGSGPPYCCEWEQNGNWPATLYLCIDAPDCPCVDGAQVQIFRASGSAYWYGNYVGCDGGIFNTISFSMTCLGGALTLFIDGEASEIAVTQCDPFEGEAVFDGIQDHLETCPPSTWTVAIGESPCGSGSGGPPPSTTVGCCPDDALPDALYLVIPSDASCECYVGTHTLNYDAAEGKWIGYALCNGTYSMSFSLWCYEASPLVYEWALALRCHNTITQAAPSAESCSPFELTFTGFDFSDPCCPIATDITLTVIP